MRIRITSLMTVLAVSTLTAVVVHVSSIPQRSIRQTDCVINFSLCIDGSKSLAAMAGHQRVGVHWYELPKAVCKAT